jgi:hypothetical protein
MSMAEAGLFGAGREEMHAHALPILAPKVLPD